MRITDFQRRVYEALKKVPRGKVTTYKILGDSVDCKCYRAIGQAMRRNPFAPEVPCHRVIASDLSIGGFGGEWEGRTMARKMRLLAAEGVTFVNGKLAEPSRVFYIPT